MSFLKGVPVFIASIDTSKKLKKHAKDPRCNGFKIQSKGQSLVAQCWEVGVGGNGEKRCLSLEQAISTGRDGRMERESHSPPS